MSSIRIVAVSDTHNFHDRVKLPEGDILVHAGDMTNQGSMLDLEKVAQWMERQNFKHKICIAGNHDLNFEGPYHEQAVEIFTDKGLIYLQDSSVVIEDIKFYGSPWQPVFYNWAFNLSRGEEIAEKWALISDDIQVLITHGPPYGILDLVENNLNNIGRDLHQGCKDLLKRVVNLPKLKAHIFGHLHLEGGQMKIIDNIKFVNAAICTENYKPIRNPVVIEL